MVPSTREILTSLAGVYRLARFDRSGLDLLDRTPEGALRSFYAAVVVLPGYALMLAIRLWEQVQNTPLAQLVTVEGIAYVVSWTAFPVALYRLAGLLGRTERYPGALCAYNWSSLVQMTIYLPAVILASTGLLPQGLSEGLVFGVTMAMLTYQWFLLRTTLEISGLAAVALVLVDLILSALVNDFAEGLL